MSYKNKIIYTIIISFLVGMVSFSCDPHRRGHTASQVGAGSGQKYHKAPASAKRKYKSRY